MLNLPCVFCWILCSFLTFFCTLNALFPGKDYWLSRILILLLPTIEKIVTTERWPSKAYVMSWWAIPSSMLWPCQFISSFCRCFGFVSGGWAEKENKTRIVCLERQILDTLWRFKGIVQPFALGGVTRLIRSAVKFCMSGNLKEKILMVQSHERSLKLICAA